MQLRHLSLCASWVALLALIPSLASAHTLLVNPAPLQTNDDAKEPACGCTFGSGLVQCPTDYEVTAYEPGETITVTWNETIDHQGDFRVAFVAKPPDQVTDADFEAAAVQVSQDDALDGTGLKSGMLTLPTTPCAECTIQVRQFMEGADAPFYYTCAAISIGSDPGEGGSPATGGSSAQGGHSGSGGSVGPSGSGGSDSGKAGGEAVWVAPETSSGCSLSASDDPSKAGPSNAAPSGLGWPALGLALALVGSVVPARRRRRRASPPSACR